VIKTLVILAVAYGLRALFQPHRSATLFSRRRRPGSILLYGLATTGALAVGGLVFLVALSVQAHPPQSPPLYPDNLVARQSASPASSPIAGTALEPPPVQTVEPGTQPAYVLLNTTEPLKTPVVEKEKPRPRVRPKVQNRASNRPKSTKKP